MKDNLTLKDVLELLKKMHSDLIKKSVSPLAFEDLQTRFDQLDEQLKKEAEERKSITESDLHDQII